MSSVRYLNAILTILAVLLFANVWVGWQHLGGDWAAPDEARAAGVTNAGEQRAEMIGLLKKANSQLGDVKKMLSEGDVVVKLQQSDNEQQQTGQQ